VNTVRRTAAVLSLLMSLADLPIAFTSEGEDIPTPLGWSATLLGVVGIVVAVALLRSTSWGPAAVVAVGVLTLLFGALAFTRDIDGGIAGLVVGLAIAMFWSGAPAGGSRKPCDRSSADRQPGAHPAAVGSGTQFELAADLVHALAHRRDAHALGPRPRPAAEIADPHLQDLVVLEPDLHFGGVHAGVPGHFRHRLHGAPVGDHLDGGRRRTRPGTANAVRSDSSHSGGAAPDVRC
jgi:hypothetical protein